MSQRQELAVGAAVEGTDGELGRLTDVIVDPVRRRVTHVVVREQTAGARTFVVPVDKITAATRGTVRVACSFAELRRLPEFRVTRFVPATAPEAQVAVEAEEVDADLAVSAGTALYYTPYVTTDDGAVAVTEARVPAGELAFSKGARVRASDGHEVGAVEEFVLDPRDETISHVIARAGHLLRAREFAVPLSAVAAASDDVVTLRLTRREVEGLPHVPVRRHYDWAAGADGGAPAGGG
jgi:sporulation protein YlmC with PRC-barrel domain